MSSRRFALVCAVVAVGCHVLGHVIGGGATFFVGGLAGLFTMAALSALGDL